MKSRLRLLMTIGLGLIGVVLIIYLISWTFLMSRFAGIEQEEVQGNARRVQNSIRDDFAGFTRLAGEWARQDVTCFFMENRDRRFVEPIVKNSIMQSLRINLIVFMKPDTQIVFAKAYDINNRLEVPLAGALVREIRAFHLNMRLANPGSRFFGIATIDNRPLIVTAAPIIPSNGLGSKQGFLILGRYFDRREARRVANLTNLPVKLYLPGPRIRSNPPPVFGADSGQIIIRTLGQHRISGYFRFRDVKGQPAIVIGTMSRRLFVENGRLALEYFLIWLLVVAAVFGLVIYFLIGYLHLSQKGRQDSEERYHRVVNEASDGITLIDLTDNRISEANPAFLEMAQRSEAELDKIAVDEIFEGIDFPLLIKKTLREKNCLIQEAGLRRPYSGPVNVEVSLTHITQHDRAVLLAVIRDISERKRTNDLLRENYFKLQSTLDQTVNALATVGEKRDPYTAGHQKRVAQLAVAIGREMGLTLPQLEGLRIAGVLHDIGKIYVPAEILSKPGRITAIEFNMIKSHSQVGYEILKDIPFENPVARIVFQHHERVDGSGYPQGICGEKILLEARILAVADVVEAIASHRPYRPALGIQSAVAEIIKNQGILYDAAIVAAAHRVIVGEHFQFVA